MKFGLFTSGYQYLELEKAFADAKAFGYDFIELWGGFPHAYPWDMDEERVSNILWLSEKYSIPVRVYTPEHNGYPYNYMLADQKQVKRILDYFKKSIEVTSRLKAKYMLMSIGYGGNKEKLLDFLKEVVKYAEEYGVIIVLETLSCFETKLFNTSSELKEIIETIASDNLAGVCDVVAAHSCNETLKDYFDKVDIKHVHLVDGDGKSENHLIPTEGIYPIKEMLDYLKKADYQGGITVELVTHYIDNPSLAFEKSIKNLEGILNA